MSCLLSIALSSSGCGGAVSEDQSSDGPEAVDASSAALNELPGRYVGDALSGRSYNLADYERVSGDTVPAFTQSPRFDPMVASGQLMSVEERLPQNPLVVVPWEDAGEHGGELRYFSTSMLGDIYLRHLNEVRLLELRPEAQSTPITKWILGTLEPGVFEHWEQSEDATQFTFRIRRGLKWSDGVEVTSEDARFCIEDAVLNEELYPVAQPWSHWGGDPVEVELIDRYSFRLRFAGSYGLFLPRLVMWRWSWLLLPSHYLKQFHRDYTPVESLLPLMEDEGYAAGDWAIFYDKVQSRRWGAEEFVPGAVPSVERYPTLDPWLHVSQPNPGDFVLESNPYYYKVDPLGRQLPYIDRLVKVFASNTQVVILKILAGETDFQRDLPLSELPLIKKSGQAGNYYTMLLPDPQDYRLIFPMNLSPADPVLREIIRDVRFRQALSLALNREEIRDVLLLGFGRPAQLAPLPGTPWYEEAFTRAYADFDPERANGLLDEVGLRWDDDHQWRLRSDGERLTLRLDVDVNQAEWVGGAELAREYWRGIGIDVIVKPTLQFGNLLETNQNHLTAWHANAAVPVDRSFISSNRITPLWHRWYMSGGTKGEEPPDWMKQVYDNRLTLFSSASEAVRTRAGKEIFRILSEKLWVIGVVAEVPVPVIYSRELRNISVAEPRRLHSTVVADAADQWFFSAARRK
jgi:peptide/nickel transport system substrate-binding protein